jgi:hypothetical protein
MDNNCIIEGIKKVLSWFSNRSTTTKGDNSSLNVTKTEGNNSPTNVAKTEGNNSPINMAKTEGKGSHIIMGDGNYVNRS